MMIMTNSKFKYHLLFLFLLAVSNAYAELNTLSTGVGIEQRQESHSNYALKLVFFVNTGGFLADIDIEISTATGKPLLATNSYGPWFFVDLEPGHYKVTASRKNGDRQSASFYISTGDQLTISLMFPDH